MDPDANLEEQKLLARFIIGKGSDELKCASASRLAELVIEMDDWLSKKGCLPKPWHHLRLVKL